MALKVALDTAMTADSYSNRNGFAADKLCGKFWSQFVEEEKKRFVKEEAEREAAEKKAAEEAAKKAKEAAEKAKKEKEEEARREQKAKEEAEKKAAAEAARKKIEEAKRVKLEAQEKAAKAAEQLAKKKAEAEEMAKKAQQKMQEAEEAEREHKKAIANLTAHANSTAPVASTKEEVKSVVAAVVNSTAAQSVNGTVVELSAKSKTAPRKTTVVEAPAKHEKLATVNATGVSNSSGPVASAK